MSKRRLIAVLIAFVLTIFATAMWSASTDEREGDPDAIVLEDSGSEAAPWMRQTQEGWKQSRQSFSSAVQGLWQTVRSRRRQKQDFIA